MMFEIMKRYLKKSLRYYVRLMKRKWSIGVESFALH